MSDLCVRDGQTLLFMGDSITDAGRRGDSAPFGIGYASLFIDLVAAKWPERKIRFINKGIGGNTVIDLFNRWEDDVTRHRPDWLTVMIGINDLHRTLRNTMDINPIVFREHYVKILEMAREKTDAQLVLLDPFYMSTDYSGASFRSEVLKVIPDYLSVVQEMAELYGARHVGTHEMFKRHLKFRESESFCQEPVHPNRTGHLLIALELLNALVE